MTGRNGSLQERCSRVSGGAVSVDLDGADHVDHALALVAIDRVRTLADVAQIEVVASAIAGALHRDDGHRNSRAWIVATLDVGRITGGQWVRRGELAVSHPGYLDALRDGRFHLDHYDVIARAAANRRARGLLGDFLDEFAAAARSLPFADFERMISVWVQLADESGREPDHRVPTRGLNVRSRGDGSCTVHGFFGPEAATVIREILGRFLDEETRLDRDAAAEIAAAGGSDELPRSLMERRADALLAALAQTVTRQPGEAAKPLTNLVLSWQAAQQLIAGFDPANPVNVNDLLCRSLDGDPVDPHAVLAGLIEGRVQVLVVDALGNPFTLGSPTSLFTEKQRHALRVLHAQCEYPGCSIHGRHLEADHLQPRSRGGPTSMDNAAAVCGRHNRWRFTHGYHLTRDADGTIHAYRPDGTPLQPRPARPTA